MTALFDGVSGMLSDVFGAPLTYRPQAGAPRLVQSMFREEPLALVDGDGHPVRSVAPSWKVKRHLVPELKRGDLITLADGRSFEVQAVSASGSPAADAFVICDLFEVLP